MSSELDQKTMRGLGLLTAVVADLAGGTGVGLALGWLAWKKLGWPVWILLITTFAGFGVGMYQVYRLSQKADRDGGDARS